eukprot:3774172-Rhodomonas_salina.3
MGFPSAQSEVKCRACPSECGSESSLFDSRSRWVRLDSASIMSSGSDSSALRASASDVSADNRRISDGRTGSPVDERSRE